MEYGEYFEDFVTAMQHECRRAFGSTADSDAPFEDLHWFEFCQTCKLGRGRGQKCLCGSAREAAEDLSKAARERK